MLIGYARVSTRDQNLTGQIEQLKTAGCTKIFEEKKSGVDRDREQLALLMDSVRVGDTVVCCKLDRIARSTQHLLEIAETLQGQGVGLRILGTDIDTTTSTGKLMLTMLGAIATFEREIMLERQRDGIEQAKLAGKYKGRKATTRSRAAEVLELLGTGLTKQAVADRLGIGVASVYRIAKEARS
ncbi:MAG: recombinase family protein [Geobacter sp.]|nr:recombinase family protein [Geobacter sp.]